MTDGQIELAKARRLADLPDFKVLARLEEMRKELSDGREAQ